MDSLTSLRYRHGKSDPDVPVDVDYEIEQHLNDPNWDISSRTTVDTLELGEKKKAYNSDDDATSMASSREVGDLDDDSPYPEVRAAVPNTDDPSIPVNTFRVWFLGTIVTILLSGMNQFFGMRYPSVFITGLVAQLVSLPAGKFMEWALPTKVFNVGGVTFSFNPGPFNVKEHVLITVMANVVAGGAYATDVIAVQRMYFNQNWGASYQLLLVISSQMLGFAFAGLTRRFLVWPASMLWPGALVNASLFSTLHKAWGTVDKRHMSREKFFLCALGAGFVWYFLPGYLFTALSIFNWVCWIAPNNIVVNQVFGYSTGLGMGFITFDWAMIAYIGSPLVTPWWAEVNIFAAVVLVYWIAVPIIYYKNVFFSKFMPISAAASFDNTGNEYDPLQIIVDGEFDVDAYRAYSPIFIPATFAVSYGMGFATLTSIFTHTFLWYRRDIVRQFRSSLRDHKDVHARLMMSYKEVPGWWYGILGGIAMIFAIITVEVWDTKLPVWGLVFAILIAGLYMIPSGMLQAITNQTISLNILAEVIVGYVLPGRPIAMMLFKTYCFFTVSQGTGFISDMKLGHYMKIPPRAMFWAQTLSTLVSCFVVVGVQAWQFENIDGFCTPDQPNGFTCPSLSVFVSAAMIWGGIGPQRTFSVGQLYSPLLWFFLIGLLAPIPFYFAAKRWPRSPFRYVNLPVFFTGVGAMPPATGINFSSWFFTGFIFQYYMRRKHFRWWIRYNYILSAAMDSAVGLALIIIFFALQYPKGGVNLNWWGNTVWQNTLDSMGAPFYTLQPNETFGPTTVRSLLPVLREVRLTFSFSQWS
ncbi:OPT oligopeptide transporter [Sistotremastrum niveocremeum HHB9708]|uniref:OPT oligopeptide transporter n=1 Tax=Sistotremastrum niveocremeum HHB9708 TaxID=1314777 RepID=A0A164YTT4_9AGAM|nr:OPT oligopeptide transporter [Sistotremastrum niveocremeum HHB9708]